MKSIILLGIIWAFNFSDVANDTNETGVDGPAVSVDFRLGNSNDCTGWGVCYFRLEFNGLGRPLAGVHPMMGNIKMNHLDSGFELKFSKDELMKIQPDKLVYLDGKTQVTFTESFQIPNEVREALDAQKDLVIKPGTYPLTFIDGIFTIKFP